jgi:hypothetical protein
MRKKIIGNRKAQDQKISKRNFSLLSRKSGQEELVGFGLIIVVVAIILLVFISTTLRKPAKEGVESYEVNAFIGSTLQYTSVCQKNLVYLNVKDLMFECANNAKCSNNLDSCYVLENTIREILKESWKVQEGSVVKGYELVIDYGGEHLVDFREGELDSDNFKGDFQDSQKGSTKITFYFTAYY